MNNLKIDNLKDLIIKSLDYYDRKNYKYKNNQVKIIFDKIIIYKTKDQIGDSDDNILLEASLDLIGVYNVSSNVWIWGWVFPYENNKIILSKYLLNYGLELDLININAEQLYLKGLLTNSRYIVNDDIGLDINMAIFTYLLKDKIQFIYSSKDESLNIIKYYAVI
jgi:hypothetical protein